jgi:hypothetical protein
VWGRYIGDVDELRTRAGLSDYLCLIILFLFFEPMRALMNFTIDDICPSTKWHLMRRSPPLKTRSVLKQDNPRFGVA